MAILQTYPECADPYRQREHVGLDFAYGAGRVRDDNSISNTVAGTVTLADDTTNYVESTTAGVVSANAAAFTAGRIPLFTVVTAAGAIGAVTDKRAFLGAGGGSGSCDPDVLTTKGDVLVHDGTNYQRVPVGTNDHVLTADSAQALGVKWAAGGGGGITSPLSADLDFADYKAIKPEIKDYGETTDTEATSGATYTIDLQNGNVHDVTLSEACTLTFSNPPASGIAGSFTLILRQDGTGSRAVTWPASVDWPAGSVPVISTAASAVDIFTFVTVNAGTVWFGFLAGRGMA